MCVTENMVTQRRRTHLNPSSLLPVVKKKKNPPKVASRVVLLSVPAPEAQSLAHRCRNKIMAAGSLQSRRQKPPEKQRSGQEGALWLRGGEETHIGTFLDEDLIQLVSQGASRSHAGKI